MSDTTIGLRRKIDSAKDLQSVVRTMKALAASSIGQYERSVRALADYYRTVEIGLGACFRQEALAGGAAEPARRGEARVVGAVVFGSDQGLVGQFNEVIGEYATEALTQLAGTTKVWAVGERAHTRLEDLGHAPIGRFAVPNSVKAIAPLVGRILVACEGLHRRGHLTELHLFYNRPTSGAVYTPVRQRLLPLDESFRRDLASLPWPTEALPQVLGADTTTLGALLREHLFISLFRACAESLASENASRLAAMERADKNIDELLDSLNGRYHRLRQSGIDEELFDVIAGVEALATRRG